MIQFMLLRRGRFSGEVLGTNGSVICDLQSAESEGRRESSEQRPGYPLAGDE